MLDPHGFVATCNSTHFFIVRNGEVWTSSGKYCLGGITRGLVLEIAREAGIPGDREGLLAHRRLRRRRGVRHRHLRRHRAGARGRRPPVCTCRGPMVERLQKLYAERVERDVAEQQPAVTVRIAMWSGPRNLSTAMMRSFGSRSDTFVSDEPFYGCFLKTPAPITRCAKRSIAAMDCDWRSVMADASRASRRTARRSGTRSTCGTTWWVRSAMSDFARLQPCLPDPRARADDRLLPAQARSGRASRISGWSGRPNSSIARPTGSAMRRR